MFTNTDIEEYYDTTQVHYERWWNLKKSHSLHYGIWEKDTKSFKQALENTNKVLKEAANISSQDRVLDAGCGVGGAAFYIAKNAGAEVVGISLSQSQVDQANATAQQMGIANKASFSKMDFTKTSFPDESFDVVWACESICHANNKADFITESYRILKKGGRLVLFDFFVRKEADQDPNNWIAKWKDTWAVSNFVSVNYFTQTLSKTGFSKVDSLNYTSKIRKSAKRMLIGYWLGLLFSESYAFFFPKVSRFARDHYKCGYYQYKALKEDLWRYELVKAIK